MDTTLRNSKNCKIRNLSNRLIHNVSDEVNSKRNLRKTLAKHKIVIHRSETCGLGTTALIISNEENIMKLR